MDIMEQAHHELERLQGIITRHEGHMFTLRGWLLTVAGGLLAAYYTGNIQLDAAAMRVGLPLVALLFLFVESRHANLVEAVVERATAVEHAITRARRNGGEPADWYDGPQVSAACLDGAKRRWPRSGMTFFLNRPFYLVVVLIILAVTLALPPRTSNAAASVCCAHPSSP